MGIWWVEAGAAINMGQDTGQPPSAEIPVPECQSCGAENSRVGRAASPWATRSHSLGLAQSVIPNVTLTLPLPD